MQLDDIDWRRAEITVGGKGGRGNRLPLPADVGHTVAGYLRHDRPATALDRSVFIRIKTPHRGLTFTGVTQVVAAAAQRAGLDTIYAHRLRHSAATSMPYRKRGAPNIRHRTPKPPHPHPMTPNPHRRNTQPITTSLKPHHVSL